MTVLHRDFETKSMVDITKSGAWRYASDASTDVWCLAYAVDDARREQLYAYCRQDVEVERELHHRLPLLSPAEQELWLLDQVVNDRGFHVDRALAEAARRVVSEEQARINRELADLTAGAVT